MKNLLIAAMLLCGFAAQAQYNASAGLNAPTVRAYEEVRDEKTGKVERRQVDRAVAKDGFGNARGNQFDLAVDGAFEGETVAVLHLYTGEGFDFALPKAALKEKGFNVYRWVNQPPSPKELAASLEKSDQLWVISDATRKLTDEHIAVIKKFFDAGHGVYIWGDNEPYYADANAVSKALLGVEMSGNVMGDVGLARTETQKKAGLLRGHLLTTGLEFIYEGITIATIQKNEKLTPLIHGSADNLVTAVYEKDGKRAILDGGFTRLFLKWDTAGTGRYVKNAAAWLANAERFGTAKAGSKAAGSK
jgi:hypothetical protein